MIMTMMMTMRISSIVIEVIGVFYFFNEEILHIKKAQKSTKSTQANKKGRQLLFAQENT